MKDAEKKLATAHGYFRAIRAVLDELVLLDDVPQDVHDVLLKLENEADRNLREAQRAEKVLADLQLTDFQAGVGAGISIAYCIAERAGASKAVLDAIEDQDRKMIEGDDTDLDREHITDIKAAVSAKEAEQK